MGYKKQLKEVIRKFNALKDIQKEKLDNIDKSDIYAEEGKNRLKEQVRAEASGLQEEFTNEAVKIIEAARKETLARKTSITKDQNFNTQLSNALTVLNTVGKDMSTEELKTLVEPFKEDYYTMEMLRKTLINNGIKNPTEIFGVDTIESDLQVLDKVESEIKHSFFGELGKTNTMTALLALEYLSGSDTLENGAE